MAAKNVLVTGASTGIGEACALHLDGLGWRVFAGVRTEADGDALRRKASDRLTPVLLDVTDDAGVVAALASVADAVGDDGLSGLVNNAGVARGGPIEFLPLEEWRSQFAVNVFGQLTVTRAAMPLIRRGSGRIVFMGSISGRMSSAFIGPYSASKHAIEAIGAALREELRPWSIPVSVIEPGVIKTPIWDKAQATADELEQSLGDDATTLYRKGIDELRKQIERSAKRAADVDKVSAAVEHALTSGRPRYRYLVGTDAKVAGTVARFLPDRLLAFAVRAAL